MKKKLEVISLLGNGTHGIFIIVSNDLEFKVNRLKIILGCEQFKAQIGKSSVN